MPKSLGQQALKLCSSQRALLEDDTSNYAGGLLDGDMERLPV
jgi:hypothetical protein